VGGLLFLLAEAAPVQAAAPVPAAEVLEFDCLYHGWQFVSKHYQ